MQFSASSFALMVSAAEVGSIVRASEIARGQEIQNVDTSDNFG